MRGSREGDRGLGDTDKRDLLTALLTLPPFGEIQPKSSRDGPSIISYDEQRASHAIWPGWMRSRVCITLSRKLKRPTRNPSDDRVGFNMHISLKIWQVPWRRIGRKMNAGQTKGSIRHQSVVQVTWDTPDTGGMQH